MKDSIGASYLFYANPKTFPDWKYSERFAICMNISTSYYRDKPVWRYKIKKGAYQDYVFEIEKEKAYRVVIKNAIPGSECPDLLPISEMTSIAPKK